MVDVVQIKDARLDRVGHGEQDFAVTGHAFVAVENIHLAKTQAAAQGVDAGEITGRWTRNIPMGRLGRPDEFAAVVAFLCSERAGYVTGASIAIDGGVIKGVL